MCGVQDHQKGPYASVHAPQAPGAAAVKYSLMPPAAVVHLAVIGAFMLFGNRIAIQVMIDYFSFDYGLNDSARSVFVATAMALTAAGQVVVALLCDRYFGVVRGFRLGLCLSLVALLGLLVLTGNGAPNFHYAGKSYEVANISTTNQMVQFVKIEGQSVPYSIADDGAFVFEKQPANGIPMRIAPQDWYMDMGEDSANKILILLPMALLILARCFGLPVVLAALGSCYGDSHRARTLGFAIFVVLVNCGYVMMQLTQLYLEPLLGRKAVLGLATSLMFVAYLRGRYDRALARAPVIYKKSAPPALRNRAYLLLSLTFAVLTLAMLGTLLNAMPHTHPGGGEHFFTPSQARLDQIMFTLLVGGTLLALILSWIYEKRASFYACLAVVLLAALHLIFWTLTRLGVSEFTRLSLGHVDLSFFQSWHGYALNVSLMNPLVIFLFGGIFVLIWARIGHRMPKVSTLGQYALGLLLVAASYYMLALGVHMINPQGQIGWPYYVFALLGLPLSELLVAPALCSAAYHLRRKETSVTTLAFLSFTATFSTMLGEQLRGWGNQLSRFGGEHADTMLVRALSGDYFLALGSAALLICGLTLVLVRPLYLRTIGAAGKK